MGTIRKSIVHIGDQKQEIPTEDTVQGVPANNQFIKSDSNYNTTSSAYVTKPGATLTVPGTVPDGDYWIDAMAELGNTKTNRETLVQLYNVTDALTLGEIEFRPTTPNERAVFKCIDKFTMAGAAKTFEIQLRVSDTTGGPVANARRCRLRVRRAS